MAQQIVIDVYNQDGQRIGQPIISATTASVERRLDGVGSIQFSVPAMDRRAAEYLLKERSVVIRYERDGQVFTLGQGILRKDDYNASNQMVSYSGPDELDDLKRVSTLTNLRYNAAAYSTVVRDLLGLASGWSLSGNIFNPITARFDGTTILKAIQTITSKLSGLHFRLGEGRVIEAGTFGAFSGVKLINPSVLTPAMQGNDTIALISAISVSSDTSALATRLYPYGAGQNLDTALTLELSNRFVADGYPYVIQQEIRNGRTHYFLQDQEASQVYGVIEKMVKFQEIAPLSAESDIDVQNAANALYDAAAAALKRMSVPQTTYRVSVTNLQRTLHPGDTVRLVYEDPIVRTGDGISGVQPPRSINQEFVVLSVTEKLGDDGHSVDLEISNVDQFPQTTAQKIFQNIDELKAFALQIQPSIVAYPYSESVNIDAAGNSLESIRTIEFPMQNFVYRVDRVVMRVRTSRFEASTRGAAAGGGVSTSSASGGGVATSSAGGGNHDHRVAVLTSITGFPSTSTRPYYMRDGTGGLLGVALDSAADEDVWTEGASGDHTHNISIPNHTHAISIPDHTHDTEYGVFVDTMYPGLSVIRVNGQVVASGLGDQSTEVDEVFDITDAILNKAGGFRGVHTVEIRADEGRGKVTVNFDASIYMLPYQYTET